MPPNAKLENTLSLSLTTTPQTTIWNIIIKYNQNIKNLESEFLRITPLINNYALVTIRQDLIPAFASLDEVEFLEAPKALYFE
jgi:hypothetical protein